LRVPFIREGLQFYLSGQNIEIATECSGIRSSFALLVLTALMSNVLLQSVWRKVVLVSAVVPLVLVKNGIRIVTLSLLAIRVDPAFLAGWLHHSGGFIFFGVTLFAEAALCWALRRSEHSRRESCVRVEMTG